MSSTSSTFRLLTTAFADSIHLARNAKTDYHTFSQNLVEFLRDLTSVLKDPTANEGGVPHSGTLLSSLNKVIRKEGSWPEALTVIGPAMMNNLVDSVSAILSRLSTLSKDRDALGLKVSSAETKVTELQGKVAAEWTHLRSEAAGAFQVGGSVGGPIPGGKIKGT